MANHETELLDLSNLRPARGARRNRKRIGRGIGSGTGKTAGRGHKGRGARSGGNTPPQYEGGQVSMARRLPKRGFRNPNKVQWAIINLADLERFDEGTVVDRQLLVAAGLVHASRPIKLLADGTLQKKLTIKVDKASEAARKKIADLGGTVEVHEHAPAADAAGAGEAS